MTKEEAEEEEKKGNHVTEVIQEVNRKAVLTAVGILVLCVIIYWVAKLAVYLTTALWTRISGLF